MSTSTLSSPAAAQRPPQVLSVPAAALAGAVAVLAALGAGHLVAGYLDPQSSPYLAVGNSFIDRTPPWLKDFAVNNFGTNDKLVLLLSMGLVMVLFGAAAGVLCRRNIF
ncbi:MAG: oxidoreductase, partial [Mycobacteriaceae bacterium]